MASGTDNFNLALDATGVMGLYNPNPYLEFTGQIPMAGYSGTPTDAQGKQIQSYLDAQKAHDSWTPPATPGTTLTSTPGQTYGLQPSDLKRASQLNPSGNQAFGMANWGGMMSPHARQLYQNQMYQQPGSPHSDVMGANQAGAGTQGTASAPTNPVDMRQAYLAALSNPGKVTTPGAQMLPGTMPTGAPQPSVLNQFLAAHPSGGTTGAGGYNNKGFFDTLNQLQAQKPGAP